MKLTILSLNCWLLPPHFSSTNQKRLSLIVSTLQNINPDIIALQEVWLNKYKSILKHSLPNRYSSPIEGVYNKTGLFTSTNRTPLKRDLQRFPLNTNLNLIELLARKGYERLEFDDCVLINTHLYAPMVRSELPIVKSQLDLLRRVVHKESKLVIVVGDFNLNAKQAMKVLGGNIIISPVVKKTVDKSNPLTKSRFNRLAKTNEALDHLFVYSKSKNIIIKTKVIKSPIFSDHYAVKFNLEVR